MDTVNSHENTVTAQPKPARRLPPDQRAGRGGPLCAKARRTFKELGLSALVQLVTAASTTDDAAKLKAARTILTASRRAVSDLQRQIALQSVIELAGSEATTDRVRVEAIELLQNFGTHGRKLARRRAGKGAQ